MNLLLRDRRLLLLCITLFNTMVGFGVILPVLPYLARGLQATPLQQGLIVTFFAFAQMISAPIWGGLSDRWGRKPILVLGLFGFSITYLFMPLAPNMGWLLVLRFLGGFLVGGVFPTAFAMTADLTDVQHRASVMAWMGGANFMGFSLGPALGGLVLPLGFKAPFILTFSLGILTAAFAHLMLPNLRGENSSAVAEKGPSTSKIQQALRMLFKSRISVFLWLVMIMSLAGSQVFSMIGYYLIDKLQGNEKQVSLVYTLLGGTGALVQFLLVSWALKTLGAFRTLYAALSVGVLGFVFLATAPTMATIYLAVCLAAVAMGVVYPVVVGTISSRTDAPQGITMGVQTSIDSFGRIIGPMLAGYLYGFRWELPFWSGFVAILIGLLVAFTAHQAERRQELLSSRVDDTLV